MRNKPKFSKKRCLRCKYHGLGHHGFVTCIDGKGVNIYCNYATITGHTCLKPVSPHESVDLRGDDYYNCRLFSEGKMIRERNVI